MLKEKATKARKQDRYKVRRVAAWFSGHLGIIFAPHLKEGLPKAPTQPFKADVTDLCLHRLLSKLVNLTLKFSAKMELLNMVCDRESEDSIGLVSPL